MGLPRFFSPSLTNICVCAAALLATAAPQATAQDAPAPAQIAMVDGLVTLEREAQSQDAGANLPFLPGDQLRTTQGRVELLFADGSALDLDEYSSIDLQSLDPPILLRMTAGRALLTVPGITDPARAVTFQIDTPAGSVLTEGPGEYRLSLFSGPEVELAVFRGSASLWTDQASTRVVAGERSFAQAVGAPSQPRRFNSARFDAFASWSAARRDDRLGRASAQYLPPNLQTYGGTLDRHGSWHYEAPYGQVWYPTVAPDWRPYYRGYWSPLRVYGWTWIGVDVWSWPTHHYGRWGHVRGRWFWIPDRRWAPAWVTWASAPGYVSWCPLGFDNRPVFALSVGIVPRSGWVVLPRGHFGARGVYVDRYAVSRDRLSGRTRFAVVPTAPVAPPPAVVRGGAVGAARTARATPQRRAVPRADVRGAYAAPTPSAGPFALPTDRARIRSEGREAVGSTSPAADRARTRAGASAPAGRTMDADRSVATPTAAPRSAAGRRQPPASRVDAPSTGAADRPSRAAPAIPRALPRANRATGTSSTGATPTSRPAEAPRPSLAAEPAARPRRTTPAPPREAPETRSVPAGAARRSRQGDALRSAPSAEPPGPAREAAPARRRAGSPAGAAAAPAGRAAPSRGPSGAAAPAPGARRAAPRDAGAARSSGNTETRQAPASRAGAARAGTAARRGR